MSRFLNPRLRALQPYTPGKQPGRGRCIKLNTNENPYPPAPGVADAVREAAAGLQLYSSLEQAPAKELLAEWLGLAPEQVLLGNGSDELLAFCFQALCPQGAAFPDLTYGFYPVYCDLYGVQAQIIPLEEDFSIAPAKYAGLGKTIFLANPNAPTGLALTPAQLEEILHSNADSLVVVDEAYVAFGAQSAVPLLARYENLLVVGTFSKSRSLAGGRLGYAAGSAGLIDDLQRVRYSFNPYNVNALTLAAGGASLRDEAYYQSCRRRVVATRGRIQQEVRALGFTATDSLANFLFIHHPLVSAKQLFLGLQAREIHVRWFDQPRIRDYLRVSVGSDAEMDAFLDAVREILEREVKG